MDHTIDFLKKNIGLVRKYRTEEFIKEEIAPEKFKKEIEGISFGYLPSRITHKLATKFNTYHIDYIFENAIKQNQWKELIKACKEELKKEFGSIKNARDSYEFISTLINCYLQEVSDHSITLSRTGSDYCLTHLILYAAGEAECRQPDYVKAIDKCKELGIEYDNNEGTFFIIGGIKVRFFLNGKRTISGLNPAQKKKLLKMIDLIKQWSNNAYRKNTSC